MSEPRLATPPSVPSIDSNELRVTRLRALRGPNYWRLAPVIACDVRLGALEPVTSAIVPGFNERLLGALPNLRDHPCTKGAPGGFVERLERGTHIPHILEHVALELQNLAGSDVGFGRVVASGDAGVWWVIVAYDEEDVGLQSMRDAVSLVRAALGGQAFDVAAAIAELQDLFERVRLGPSTWAIVEEARRRGIPVRRLNSRSLVQLGLGRNLRRIQATLTDHTSAIAIEIAQNKDDTKRVLEAIGLPVPHGHVATSAEEAVGLAQEIGFPVILKPLDLSHGRGISPRLTTRPPFARRGSARSSIRQQRHRRAVRGRARSPCARHRWPRGRGRRARAGSRHGRRYAYRARADRRSRTTIRDAASATRRSSRSCACDDIDR